MAEPESSPSIRPSEFPSFMSESELKPEAAGAKRRRTGPPGAQRELAFFGEFLTGVRLDVEALARQKRCEDGGSSTRTSTVEKDHKSCFEWWIHLASRKMHLELSGMSESERSAEALPWLAEAVASGRGFTWQESQEFERHRDSLIKLIGAVGRDERFAELGGEEKEEEDDDEDEDEEEGGGGCNSDLKMDFLRLAKARRRALLREVLRLNSLEKGTDFSGMVDEPIRAAEAEKLRQEKLLKARRLLLEGDPHGARVQEACARIIDFDAKMRGVYYNSIFIMVNLATFDHMEESPVPPVRYAGRVSRDMMLQAVDTSLNILSVEIACSDIGFPIQVYGTVVARDYIDYKRVYLFRRDSDHPQLINTEKEALILTGPKRALTLTGSPDFVETDLWVKDHQGHCRQFSKGIIWIPGTVAQIWEKGEAERLSLGTRLSIVDVTYDVILRAVEASIAVEVIQGEFCGSIDAHTSSSSRRILLYDSSKVAGGSCHGVIQLLRAAVSVCVEDQLVILAKNDAGACGVVQFTPCCGGETLIITLDDATTLRVKVVWSMIDICPWRGKL